MTPKMRLDNEGEVRALAEALSSTVPTTTTTPPAAGAPPTAVAPPTTVGATLAADELRQQALARLIADPASLAALVSSGFLAYEPPPSIEGDATSTSTPSGLGNVPVGGTRYVVVSGAGAEVGDDILALPLAQALAAGGGRAVAAEAGQDTDGGRGVFVGLLRSDATVNGKVSTVDNLESPMGQAAVVLALEEMGSARVGHFGVGPGAQRLLPALPA